MSADDGLRNPLALVPAALWAHAAFMAIGAGIVLPCGAMLARHGSASHRYVQASAVTMIVTAVVAALSTEGTGAVVDSDRRVTKRHLPPLVAGEPHTHASTHSFVGLALVGVLVAQAAVGCGASSHARGSTYPRMARWHRVVGRAVVMIVVPLQIGTGVVALFQLCAPELSGVDQCVGHNGVGVALLAAAATYWFWGDRPAAASSTAYTCRYDIAFIEHGGALGAALVVALYSVYSEMPYSAHPNGVHHLVAGIVLALMSTVALALTWRARNHSVAVNPFVLRGGAVALTAVVGGSLMFAHHQLNAYGRTMHVVFGLLLYGVAATRLARWFKTLSFLLVQSAFFFMASQRGFQVLYARFYHERFPAGAAVVVLALAGAILYVGVVVCARRSRIERPQPTPRRVEDAPVDEILAFCSDDVPGPVRSSASKAIDNFLRDNSE